MFVSDISILGVLMGSSTFFTDEVFSGFSRLSEKTVHRALQIDHGSRVQYVVLGLAGFTLRCNFREANKFTIQTKLSDGLLICSPSKLDLRFS